MNKKLLIFSLVGVLTGSAAIALAFSPTPKASQQAIVPASSPSNTIVAQNPTTPTPTTSPRNTTVPRGSWMQSQEHFVTMMIPHHEGAVAMADLALNRAKHPELKQLAQTIKTTQNQEIEQMRTWYRQKYGTDVPNWGPGMHWGWQNQNRQQRGNNNTQPYWGPGNWDGWGSGRGCCMMGGSQMGTNLYALQNASDFDSEFIEQMIPHHQMGVMMAQMVLTGNPSPEIKDLAQSIIKSQTDEINQMQQWYQQWYGQS
ncbi:DUF305 domain-containing protein [Pleurocapsales cyanobacterium LEGE 06147]|nr:DUF305 domain-containing protein [Pleurocapsales cyanobacterium LEGE 06147]